MKTKLLGIFLAFISAITTLYGQQEEGNTITGLGTVGYIPKFIGQYSIGNSTVFQSGSYIGIGTIVPVEVFQIGDRWTFHDGGTKIIGYNYDYSASEGIARRIVGAPVSTIKMDLSGDIKFAFAADASANSVIDLKNAMVISNDLFVGIGTDKPTALLTLERSWGDWLRFNTTNNNGFWRVHNNVDQSQFVIGHESEEGEQTYCLYMSNTGEVSVGTSHPLSLFTVDGTITCKEIAVTLNGFPDYVFKDNYNLMSLDDLESFILTNKHLPGVSTEEEIMQNGLKVGDFNGVLLEKIEELT